MKVSCIPICFFRDILQTKTMSIEDWIKMASELGLDGTAKRAVDERRCKTAMAASLRIVEPPRGNRLEGCGAITDLDEAHVEQYAERRRPGACPDTFEKFTARQIFKVTGKIIHEDCSCRFSAAKAMAVPKASFGGTTHRSAIR